MILPGAVLGVLGGGQLGRMFTVRAREMGYRVLVLDPDPGSPAGMIADRHIAAHYDDDVALDELVRNCAAVTTEFENVPAGVLEFLSERLPVRPGPEVVAVAQDRIAEKETFRDLGFTTAPFHAIRTTADLDDAWHAMDGPAILKTARFGYDGKGQVSVTTPAELARAWDEQRGATCILERRLDLEGEVSVVLARGSDGAVAAFPPVENVHVGGILHTSTVPARLDAGVLAAAEEAATALSHRLSYVGVLAVEMFLVADGQLFLNEIAPRPHNSGHFTLDACVTDQFEQQVRALCDLPLGDPSLISPVTMINLLGDLWQGGDPPWQNALSHAGVKLHLYGKHHARPGRKMGHLNCLAGSADEALELAAMAHRALQPRTIAQSIATGQPTDQLA
jgi:5-(carboxyamino)imidazole ribonucleotide synthase